LLLLTDGIADDLADANTYACDIVRALADSAYGPGATMLDEHLKNWPTPGHYDDKTLVVVNLGDFNRISEVSVPESGIQSNAGAAETEARTQAS
jgi:hypothetical protein